MKQKSKIKVDLSKRVVDNKPKLNTSASFKKKWKKWEKYLIDNRLMKENEECLF